MRAARSSKKRYIAMVVRRFSDTLSRKAVVESHFWSAPIRSARSLVISPDSTVPTVTFSKVDANLFQNIVAKYNNGHARNIPDPICRTKG